MDVFQKALNLKYLWVIVCFHKLLSKTAQAGDYKLNRLSQSRALSSPYPYLECCPAQAIISQWLHYSHFALHYICLDLLLPTLVVEQVLENYLG